MDILRVDYQAADAPQLFTKSLKETGFAVIENHPVPTTLVDQIFSQWEKFFKSDEKFDYLYDRKNQDGYFPYRSENALGNQLKDLKEFFHYYSWGKCPENLADLTEGVCRELVVVAQTLLHWLQMNTPGYITRKFSEPLDEMIIGADRNLLRILYYPPLQGGEPEGEVRAAPHHDSNLITLLPVATASGLQVQNTSAEWQDIECDEGAIVINTGHMISIVSDDYYQPTIHRVINPEGENAKLPRMSMPFFVQPRDEVKISEKYTALSYLHERLTQGGIM